MSIRHRVRVVVCAAAMVVAPITLAGPAGAAERSVTFSYTGVPQSFTVPVGVTSIDVDACGAEGGVIPVGSPIPGVTVGNGPGGKGGRALQTLAVSPGEELAVHVGGSGDSGGWNGGGASSPDFGGHGGGASDVRQGGTTLADRAVIGGGGGGGGFFFSYTQGGSLSGGAGGGLSGGGPRPGTQTGPGVDARVPARNGSLGAGGNGTEAFGGLTSGGGGGLYGGAAGDAHASEGFQIDGASGGSGLGASFEPGVCPGDGSVTLTYREDEPPSILPSGAAAPEGQSGSVVWQIPVRLSAPSDEVVTVDWATGDLAPGVGIAQAGSDFVAGSGTATFAPGETEVFVPVEILGDTDDEPPLLWGEWGVVEFSNPSNATIDTGPFFGLGLFIIFDDD